MSGAKQNATELIQSVDGAVIRVRTRAVDVSFNELLDMHRSKELIISPDFQRLFRWSHAKRSQFIESLILELPIPPIYVIEVEDGIYEDSVPTGPGSGARGSLGGNDPQASGAEKCHRSRK
jgi:hypothetical protein